MKIWFCLTEEEQREIKRRFPGYVPPKRDPKVIIVPLEKTEEIDKMMRKAPVSRRSLGG